MNAERTGQFIRQRRIELNMSQQELADKLYISTPAISKWENGKSLPDISMIERLAEVLDTSVEALFAGEQPIKGIIELSEREKSRSTRKAVIIALAIVFTLLSSLAVFFIYQNGIKKLASDNGLQVSFDVSGKQLKVKAKSDREPIADIQVRQEEGKTVVTIYRTMWSIFYKDHAVSRQYVLDNDVDKIEMNRDIVWQNGEVISGYAISAVRHFAGTSPYYRSELLTELSRDHGGMLLEDEGSYVRLKILNDPSEEFAEKYAQVLFSLFHDINEIFINRMAFDRNSMTIDSIDVKSGYEIQKLLNTYGFDDCGCDSIVVETIR